MRRRELKSGAGFTYIYCNYIYLNALSGCWSHERKSKCVQIVYLQELLITGCPRILSPTLEHLKYPLKQCIIVKRLKCTTASWSTVRTNRIRGLKLLDNNQVRCAKNYKCLDLLNRKRFFVEHSTSNCIEKRRKKLALGHLTMTKEKAIKIN